MHRVFIRVVTPPPAVIACQQLGESLTARSGTDMSGAGRKSKAEVASSTAAGSTHLSF